MTKQNPSKTKKKIILAGGGSGGHIYPLVAVSESLKRLAFNNNLDLEFHYLGPRDVFSAVLAERLDVEMHSLWTAKLRRYLALANIIDFPKFMISLFRAGVKVFWMMPDVIFSKGGPGALPVVLAGWFYRVPIVMHESDAVPGMTNLFTARLARKIAVSFEKTASYFDSQKTVVTGNPVREELLGERYPQEAAKEGLGFEGNERLLLILGGSQGSKKINEFVLANLAGILQETQVLHQTGPNNFLEVENLSRAALLDLTLKTELTHRYQPIAYLEENLKGALIAADLVIARAGSGTIFEIAAFGKPAILIPLPGSANDHQRMNALEFAKAGAAVIIEEENLLTGIFMGQLKEVFKNQAQREKMAQASASFFKPDAAEMIAREILKLFGFE